MRTSHLLAAVLAAFLPALALAGPRPGPHPDPEIASLRRQLAAARLVHTLKLSAEQKRALQDLARRARSLREAMREDPKVTGAKEELKRLLTRAIEETRRDGRPSPETRVALETLKDRMRDAHAARRGEFKAILESMRGVLTEEQLDALAELKREHWMGRRRGHPGKRMALRFLLSDEFLAELSR
ncbi:MAG: hypothetical protein D6729_17410 [Deltaproteobacteria bacterium]|nr:MAG: hypothetical protein D6729_17410 [Deltaproteobacteria bacterium]